MNFSKIDKFMDDMLLRGVPQCELAVSVDGNPVYRKNVGFADIGKTRPSSPSDISWIFSCSKVITCITAMRLVEEGKISLDDPVSKYIPEFANLKVLDKKTGILSDATVPMTVEHLFTMTGGMNYNLNAAPLKEAWEREDSTTLSIVKAMANVPLDFEPGEKYQYSLCHDVLGAIVEIVSGMRLSEYMQKYIFDPVGAIDIGFRPNDEQKKRFCDQYIYANGTNTVTFRELKNQYALSADYDSGGAGLFSTVDDYMKIISVIANGGKTEDGYSILRPETIKLMGENHLHDRALNNFVNGRLYGYGWGLCGRVHRNPIVSCSKSPVGEFGWDGAAGAFSMIDPTNRIAMYFGTNIFGFTYAYNFIHPTIRNMLYEALED